MTEIYYFSGTGNSLHAAKELQKRIPEVKLIPMISLSDKTSIETTAEQVGFIFPVYMTSIPVHVRKFLHKINLKSSTYIFAVTTNQGYPGMINTHLERIFKRQNKSLDSYFTVKMATNSPKGLMPKFMMEKGWSEQITKEKISAMETNVQKELDTIQEVILKRQKYPAGEKTHNFLLEHIVPAMTKNTKKTIPFYSDSDCTGCGLCEKVCLSNKIKMISRKPVWQKNVQCYYCYACFNYCPVQSILIKDAYTEKNGRYHHPEISAIDVAKQKGI